ncbi:GMC family oxidoreductase [Ensifer soli]|uniref:GMC family oxidoreductase n=1 Tax=Ciceribacter sp. sgz301302 TaxID=3342379 RepID=UPI0035BA0F93
MNDASDDIVIVGAGASGAACAWRLAAAGMKVTCLEQGYWRDHADTATTKDDWEITRTFDDAWSPNLRRLPEDYPVNDTDTPIKPVMFNGVGGSTIKWGAQFPRFRPSDFRVKSLDGVADDWPIDYFDLERYYDINDEIMGTSGLAGDPGNPPRKARPMPPLPLGPGGERMAKAFDRLGWHWWVSDVAITSRTYRGRGACNHCGPCDMGCPRLSRASADITYWPLALAAGARLITGARAFEIATGSDGRATGVSYYDAKGATRHVAAGTVILAANGAGSPRLMMLSASGRHPEGLGNRSGLLGKRLMHHPTGMVSAVFPEPMDNFRGAFACTLLCQHFYETRPEHDFVRGYQMQLVRSEAPLTFALGGHQPRLPWGREHHKGFVAGFGRTASLTVTTEDLPEESNRITLDPDLKDAFGMPAPKFHYRISENTAKMIEHGIESATRAFTEAGAVSTYPQRMLAYTGFHMLGTAKMGKDPATSVVDADCRVHDCDNLLIVDGSVFVTAAALNPTPTVQAIALRAADRIIATRRDRAGAAAATRAGWTPASSMEGAGR